MYRQSDSGEIQLEQVAAVPLPRIEVLDVRRQSGDIAVQVDPAFDLRLTERKSCHETALGSLAWLTAEQRPLARMALRYKASDYGGVLLLTPRQPIVTCSTITNVRVTETTLEETILLSFHVSKAGIRSVSFLLPSWMKDARITVPMLRLKQVELASDQPDAPVRVRLGLQNEVMGSLRILVENDRLLTPEIHRAPIPIVETGQAAHRYVALESAGRDEVVIEEPVGLQALTRRQRERRELADMLGTEATQAYIVTADASGDARLTFKTKERIVVETAGARIGLAQTVLSVDANGAYRAAQSFRTDNTTEQFLEVELPPGADLWSALVAGEPVKPAQAPGAAVRRVRIPLVRTAAGDLDYEVILNYGGQLPTPGRLRAVSFPLISTVNVPVELSQVRLFLPETYCWFDFGGNMRQVTEQGDLAAEYLRYQTHVAERLAQTLEAGSLFSKARAAASFKSLKSEIEQFQESASEYEFNANLRREIASNEAIVRRGEQQIEQFGQKPQQRAVLDDNRDRLNDLFARQRTSRARNLVQDLPDTFAEPVRRESDEQAAAGDRFDRTWIASNVLDSKAAGVPSQTSGLPEGEARLKMAEVPQARRGKPQPQAPQVAQKEVKDQILRSPAGGRFAGQARRRRGLAGGGEVVERYQQQLEQRAQQEKQVFEFDASTVAEATIAADVEGDGVVTFGLEGRRVSPALAGMATGLASLPVEFSVRGVAYSFTTPRGEVAITARAVSHRSVDTAQRLGVVLLVLVIGGALYRFVRRGGPTGATGSTVLIIVGIVSILSGVLPIAGLAMVIVGGVIKSRRRRLEQLPVCQST